MSASLVTVALSAAAGAVFGQWVGRSESGSPIVHCHCSVQDSTVAVAASGSSGFWFVLGGVVVFLLLAAVVGRVWFLRACLETVRPVNVSHHDRATPAAIAAPAVEEPLLSRPKRPSDRVV
jgi:hypothetical protein